MQAAAALDPVELTRALVRRPSVTPRDDGAMEIVSSSLEKLGFSCRPMRKGGTENLFARIGSASPNLCFAGHTDVVPPGDAALWSRAPFEGALDGGMLVGRGVVDMKSAIAAFICAASRVLRRGPPAGSLSLLVTGDEEGTAEDGTKAVVAVLAAEGEKIDHCIVGEPTCAHVLGDTIKIGRRGSIGAEVIAQGVQGHVAYPHLAANPIPPLLGFLTSVQSRVLDLGVEGFQASNLEVTTVDVGNPAANVIPAKASAKLNIRFNPAHDGASLAAWLESEARVAQKGFAGRIELMARIGGEAFLTKPGRFTDVVRGAVRTVTGVEPELSTTGGTSDARFIRSLCPVAEFGLVGATMHQIDERIPAADVLRLTDVYERLIEDYFAEFSS